MNQRGNNYFNTRQLGAFGFELAALSGFFVDTSWRKPVETLRESDIGLVLSIVSFDLRALGRMKETTQPLQASLDLAIEQSDWINAAVRANNLSEFNLIIGNVKQALAYAEQSVRLAHQSGNWGQLIINRTTLADTLHQAGRLSESNTVFHETEEFQKKNQPLFPFLYSEQGFQYCDLLLCQGNYREVERRASQTLEWAERYGLGFCSIALDNLSLGRAQLLHFQHDSNLPIIFNRAVDGLRQAGTQHWIPSGLLARAAYYRVTGELDKAKKDLDEAFTIASRGGMGLHLADCHLEYARLALADRGPGTEDRRSIAREHLEVAKEMIEKMGYHRRDKEVEEIEMSLRGTA